SSQTTYSSAVRLPSVAVRQLPLRSAPSQIANTALVLFALMASSIAASSARRRKNFTRGDAAAAVIALKHQRTVMIEVEKAAVERQFFEADTDRLSDPAGAAQPTGAHRREPLLPPALGPKREMDRQRFEQCCRGDPREALIGQRGGRIFETTGCRDQIDPDPEDHEIEHAARRHFRFEQDTGELLSVRQQIVRPFEAQLQSGFGELVQRVA